MPFEVSPTSIEMSPKESQPPSLSVTPYMAPDTSSARSMVMSMIADVFPSFVT